MRLLKVVGWLVGGLFAWSLLAPLRLVTEHQDADIPNLPGDWEGERVALMADLHLGLPSGNEWVARRAVERVLRARPALVLIAGDLIHGTGNAIEPAVELIRPLVEARIPVYAVLGNHDYSKPTKEARGDPGLARELAESLRAAGVTVLCNEIVELRAAGRDEPLFLAGIGSHTAGEDRAAQTLMRLPQGVPRLVMMHHPASFDDCPPGSAPFAVSGHTHGGQVRLPLAPVWRYLTYAKEVKVFTGGWIESGTIERFGKEGNRLYVSRGSGCSVAPMRLFCPPEVTLFTLRRPSRSSTGTPADSV